MSGVPPGQAMVLARAFVSRLVEGESVDSSVARAQFIIWTIALLTVPALRISIGAWFMYVVVDARTPGLVDLATYWHKLFFIGFSVFAVGLMTLVIWDGIFPDRRDAFVFGTLPVRVRTIVFSRLAALLGVVVLVVLACNLPTLVVYSAAAGGYYGGAYGVARHAAAHLATTLAAALTTFSVVVLAQCAVLNLAGARWGARITVVLQVALVVVAVQSLFAFPGSASLARDSALTGEAVSWASVPFWFLGLYEWIAGSTRAAVVAAGWRGLAACSVSTAAAVLAYVLTYRRLCVRALESSELAGAGGRTWPLPSTPRIAVGSFTLLTLLRSRHHRLLLALYLGVGLAIGLPEILRAPAGAELPPVRTLAMPLILIFLASAGARVLFAMPRELEANWMFRMTERPDRYAHAAGAADAALLIGVVPVVACVTPLIWRGWGAFPALAHAAFCLVMGALLVEALLVVFRKIPFACQYLPGRANVRKWWPVYLTVFTTFTFTMARVSQAVMTSAAAAVLFYFVAAAAWTGLHLMRRRYIARMRGFAFEEEPEDPLVRIGLSQAST